MTSPVEEITVVRPRCGRTYRDWHRASLNFNRDWHRASLNFNLGEDFDDEYVWESSHARCPGCSHVVELDTLLVHGDVWEFRGEER